MYFVEFGYMDSVLIDLGYVIWIGVVGIKLYEIGFGFGINMFKVFFGYDFGNKNILCVSVCRIGWYGILYDRCLVFYGIDC